MSFDPTRRQELAAYYRRHLLEDVMGFWEPRTADEEFGGYLVPHDRHGVRVGTDKNMWCQSRQTWMFAALHNQLGASVPGNRWLELAKLGRDFMVEHGHAGGGRWHYLLDRQGRVLNPAGSLFTDLNCLMALCEYATASGSDADRELIETTFETAKRNLADRSFTEYHHFALDPRYIWHGPSMLIVGLAPVLRPVLGEQRTAEFITPHLDRVLHTFTKDEHQALFEVLDADGNVMDSELGQRLNPGHALESAWFCMEEALYRNDDKAAQRAAQIVDWSYRLGHDAEHGGILGFVDPKGQRPRGPEMIAAWGERWNEKIWWVQAETLYALALTAHTTDDETARDRFLDLHDYCRQFMADPEHGEWYAYLHRHGTPKEADKGNWIKCGFHLPRALMRLVTLFENGGPVRH